MEEYKEVQISLVKEDRNREDYKIIGNFILKIEIIVTIWNKKLARTCY